MSIEKWHEVKLYLIALAVKIIEKGYWHENENGKVKFELVPNHIAILVEELQNNLQIKI
ncbi:hypothetical protein [Chitinophaga rhizosphaerae]|uniref:hypothetical protein n=1 Tax=Chitinophaga rhizosphaerae TaxID=1864947 RepID=UPI0013E077B1|nr:hypothetical protein [Chitinophaga rhizosphaerae]